MTSFPDALCREGIRGTEISKALAMAGVSESACYEQRQSKEDLVSAFLKDRHAIWMRWFEAEIEARYEATGGGLEIIADVLQKGFEDAKCFGCAFTHIVTERGDFRQRTYRNRQRAEGTFGTVYRAAGRKDGPPASGYGRLCGRPCNRTSNRVHADDRKSEGESNCAAALSVSSARLSGLAGHSGEDAKLGKLDSKIERKGKPNGNREQ